MGVPPTGWYLDPTGRSPQRYWSGTEWTEWVSRRGTVTSDPLATAPGAPRWRTEDAAHLAFVREQFLPRARSAGILLPEQWRDLDDFAGSGADAVPAAQGRAPGPATAGGPARTAAPVVPVMPAGAVLPAARAATAEPRERGVVARWWARTTEAVGSDLAVHGLAYLGVLLLFVGAFGLVAFAFGDVAPTLRPVAEVVIAATPFAAAALLLHRGAQIAGRALELAGGLVLPVMAMTSLLDGVEVPPDPNGVPLVVALTGTVTVLGLGYAWWASRHPASALRYLVAPLGWLAVGLAFMGVGQQIPASEAVASITAVQAAAMAVALLVSLLLARWRPQASLSRATVTAALPGAVVIGAVAALACGAAGWPVAPVLVTGVAGVLVVELVSPRSAPDVVGWVQLWWWAATAFALVPGLGAAPAAVVGVAGFLALLERLARREAPRWLLALTGAALALALLATFVEPWWALGAWAAASGWAHARRLHPYARPDAALAVDAAAVVLPAGAVVALGLATAGPSLAVLVGAVLALLAAVAPNARRLRREGDASFWQALAGGYLAVGIGAVVSVSSLRPTPEPWLLVAALAVLTLVAALLPMPAWARPWPVVALGTWTWLFGCVTAGAPAVVRGVVPAVMALVLVVAATTTSPRMRQPTAGSVVLCGHVLGLAALAMAGTAWGLVAVVGLATVGWAVTTWADRGEASCLGAMLARIDAAVRYLPPALTVTGVAATVGLGLNQGGVTERLGPWAPVVLAAAGLACAALTWLALPPRLRATLPWAAFAAAVAAPVRCAEVWPAVAALALLVATVLVLPARRRFPPMVWVAWAALAPLAGLVAVGASSVLAALPPSDAAAYALVGVGGALAVAAAVVDMRGRAWTPRWRPSHPAVLPVVATGAAEVAAGLTLAWSAMALPAVGWVTAGVAGITVTLALLSRAGVLGGVGLSLGWAAAVLLVPSDYVPAAWIALAVTGGLLVVADLARRLLPDRTWWIRWDLPLLAVAHLTAVSAIAVAGADSLAGVVTVVGSLALAVAMRLPARRPAQLLYGLVGIGLVLTGANLAGPGWLALALAVLAATLTAAAARSEGDARTWLQLGGAVVALAAWLSAMRWSGWSDQRSLDVTAVAAAVVAMVAALAATTRRLAASWVWVWGGTALVTSLLAVSMTAVAATTASGTGAAAVAMSTATWVALAVAGVALATAATPLGAAWLRELSLLCLVAAELVGLAVEGATTGRAVAALTATTLLAALAALTARGPDAVVAWRRPALLLGTVTACAGLAVAASAAPETALLVPALLAAAAQAAAAGAVLPAVWLQGLSPLLGCAAWIAYAVDALDGNPQWYTVPIGLALLVVVSLMRQDARRRGAEVATPAVVALELLAVAFLVGASLVQTVTDSAGYALVAIVLGVAVAAWGLVTKVRRRVMAGCAVVLVAATMLVVVPLVRLLPGWSGATLWVLIGAAGLVALLVATGLEEGRAALRRARHRIAERTGDWE